MTLEEFNDNLDQLAAMPPDWDRSYKGTSGMVVSKAAIAHARTVGAALLAAGHAGVYAFPHWEDTHPDYIVALEADGWQVTVDPDGALVATVWRQATPEECIAPRCRPRARLSSWWSGPTVVRWQCQLGDQFITSWLGLHGPCMYSEGFLDAVRRRGVDFVEQQFPAGATGALLAFIKEHAHE